MAAISCHQVAAPHQLLLRRLTLPAAVCQRHTDRVLLRCLIARQHSTLTFCGVWRRLLLVLLLLGWLLLVVVMRVCSVVQG